MDKRKIYKYIEIEIREIMVNIYKLKVKDTKDGKNRLVI